MVRRGRAAVAAVTTAVLGGCGTAAGEKPVAPQVRTEERPIERRFPEFGDIESTRWSARPLGDQDSRVPGPTDVRLEGRATLSARDVRRLLDAYRWTPADGPWLTSEGFTAAVTEGRYAADLRLDPTARVVRFDAVNPVVKE
ncbi:hypothetical protein [Streptomyces roseoviridis]|uniref:Lipoprotein n=1 Tax=Streptomyces roseoviridis TaxID=67361 RepID=A0ABV5QL76_9ACTN